MVISLSRKGNVAHNIRDTQLARHKTPGWAGSLPGCPLEGCFLVECMLGKGLFNPKLRLHFCELTMTAPATKRAVMGDIWVCTHRK